MKASIASISKKGSRPVNQDTIGIYTDDHNMCLVVCDGLGAYEDSERTSQICVDTILDMQRNAVDISEKNLNLFTQAAYERILKEKEAGRISPRSCTTVACVISDGNSTVMGHIGDSRIYHFKGNKRLYLTVDHSLAMERSSSAHAETSVRFSPDRHKLTRVLGGSYFILPETYVSPEPLSDGDAFLLCTDGFWEYLTENEIQEAALLCRSPHDALVRLESLLLKRINPENNDNYSAIMAFIS